jgi:hypothetical protein
MRRANPTESALLALTDHAGTLHVQHTQSKAHDTKLMQGPQSVPGVSLPSQPHGPRTGPASQTICRRTPAAPMRLAREHDPDAGTEARQRLLASPPISPARFSGTPEGLAGTGRGSPGIAGWGAVEDSPVFIYYILYIYIYIYCRGQSGFGPCLPCPAPLRRDLPVILTLHRPSSVGICPSS